MAMLSTLLAPNVGHGNIVEATFLPETHTISARRTCQHRLRAPGQLQLDSQRRRQPVSRQQQWVCHRQQISVMGPATINRFGLGIRYRHHGLFNSGTKQYRFVHPGTGNIGTATRASGGIGNPRRQQRLGEIGPWQAGRRQTWAPLQMVANVGAHLVTRGIARQCATTAPTPAGEWVFYNTGDHNTGAIPRRTPALGATAPS